jgi:hypothetical protein
MRICLLIFFTCCALLSAEAQQVIYSIANPFQDDEGANIVRNDSTLFIAFNSNNYYQDVSTRARIIKLKEDGTFLKQVTLFGNDSIRSYINVLKVRNDSIFCVGNRTYGTDSTEQYFQIYDLDLTLLKEQKIKNFTSYKSDFVFNIEVEGGLVSFVGYSTEPFPPNIPTGFVEQRKLSQLNSVYRSYQNNGNLFCGLNKINANRYLVTSHLSSNRFYLDSSFAAIDSFIPDQFNAWLAFSSHNVGTKTVIFGTKFSYPRIDVLNSDTIANRIDSLPQSLPPGYNKPQNRAGPYSFDCFDSTFCYFGTTHNWSKPYLENTPMWITIYRLNLDGTLAWYKHFGGDANYQLFALTTASDSGLYFVANRYDWTTQNNERDMFVYYMDKNGSMLNTPESGSLQPIEAVVYPNPFTHQFEIKFLNHGITQTNVVLTDVSGRTVLQQTVELSFTTAHTVNTGHLPGGLYVLTLTDAKGNLLQRQKVVKQ